MATLYFEKISRFDRLAEPVTVSIPFARGRLQDADCLIVRDGQIALPVQRRVLATWEDGSVKWLLVHFQADLPGNADHEIAFDVATTPCDAQARATVRVSESSSGIEVDTGCLAFTVPRDGFRPLTNVRLNGRALWSEPLFGGFVLRCDGQEATTATGPVEVTVEENGPLRVVIAIRGRHRRADGSGFLDLRGRITAYAGKPYVEVEHQFIHGEAPDELSLEGLQLTFHSRATGTPRVALGQGYYRTAIQEVTCASPGDALSMVLDAETMLYQSNEHFIDCFYGDFWVDWRDDLGGLTLSIYQAHQNFPKALCGSAAGIVCALYPADAPPAPVLQGMAKTHRIQLHFHVPDTPLDVLSTRSLQFQLPDRPALSREWFRENNPWVERFFPDQIPERLVAFFSKLHDSRPKALGMLHFGDAPDAGYTNQGRGRGETVWVNNEYDRPHACALLYGLTGLRHVLDSGLVSARHWLDVDLCHYHPDPLIQGGLKIHTRYHATGGVTPSHEWTEGLLDYYFFTGRQEGLRGARSVAENIVRHMSQPRMQEPGAASVREGGWALRAMVGMYLGTSEERWKDEARRLVELYLSWYERYGALLAPYTSHSMPRVPFMISLTVNSFARYLLIEDDERVRRMIVETVDDMLDHCLGPGGIVYYKELPSLRRTAPTPHLLEALTHAYRITGERKYMEIAARHFVEIMDRPNSVHPKAKFVDASGAVISGEGGGRSFADRYTSLLIFASEAAPLGLLGWYEYPV